MSKKTDKELGVLLNALAIVLESQVSETAKVLTMDADGKEVEGVEEYYTATPALLTVAARFLKDNGITCAIEDNKHTQGLKDELAKRKKGHGNKVVGINHLSDEDTLAQGDG